MSDPIRVILLTDGDKVARRTLESVAAHLGLRCISASAGNPTPLSGPELVELITQAPHDPVLVMVDDKGNPGCGPGESALAYICRAPQVKVLGAIAVASNTPFAHGTPVDESVTRTGKVIAAPVDKEGNPKLNHPVLKGDTVDVLRDLAIPVVVGIGDPGKMHGADDLTHGSEVTTRAVEEILAKSGIAVPPPEQPAPDGDAPEPPPDSEPGLAPQQASLPQLK